MQRVSRLSLCAGLFIILYGLCIFVIPYGCSYYPHCCAVNTESADCVLKSSMHLMNSAHQILLHSLLSAHGPVCNEKITLLSPISETGLPTLNWNKFKFGSFTCIISRGISLPIITTYLLASSGIYTRPPCFQSSLKCVFILCCHFCSADR